MISIHVSAMSSRQDVRAISARISDVPDVQTLEADLAARTVRVTGPADPAAVAAAVGAAGYAVDRCVDGSPLPGARTGGHPVDTFSTDITGLPEVTPTQVLELADGETLHLRLGPVAKRLAGATVRMLAYNGSVPGPTLKVRQGSEITVRVTNEADIDTTVHWHGLRLENRYDGVPHETQAPIPVGESFTYRIQFPDPGLYWYHPHIREDYTQEMGLYGNILVEPAEPDYWPPAHRDVVLTLDDVLVEDDKIAPFSRTETTFAAMGRYGNVLLVAGRGHAGARGRGGAAALREPATADRRRADRCPAEPHRGRRSGHGARQRPRWPALHRGGGATGGGRAAGCDDRDVPPAPPRRSDRLPRVRRRS